MIPHNSILIVKTCINMWRLIGIDRQMIGKAKIWILLYKEFVVSHNESLEDKQRIYVEGDDIQWFNDIFISFFLCLVFPKAFLY